MFGKKILPDSPLQNSGLTHLVLSAPLDPPYPADTSTIRFGMGCFWGAERLFWQAKGVYVTASGYAGGSTANPSYYEVCSGRTGHCEVVQVVYNPKITPLEELLKIFWENHDPTQYMRQGNDVGTQYRSAIFVNDSNTLGVCLASRDSYQSKLTVGGFGEISTEISINEDFYLAEANHQQYLAKHPNGYCNHGFCQVEYSI